MVSIYEAFYVDNDKKTLISIEEIKPEEYSRKYWGKLFCTEAGCEAKLSYVKLPGNKSHFRKWRESPHSENCIHFAERIDGRTGTRQVGVQNGFISPEQMKKAQREAFELEILSAEERIKKREDDREKRLNKKNTKKVTKTVEQPAIRVIVDPAHKIEDTNQVKGRLYKRDVDALKEKDLGQTRTVTGRIEKVETGEKSALVRICKNNKFVNIRFGEAFFADAPQYEGLFHYIDQFATENNNAVFNATGEVKQNEQTNEFELIVFNRDGLLVHGRTLSYIATTYSIESDKN
ncbi:hypothetical protein A6g_13865 [Bacillus velezensis]|uniref:hypothetical protein n=1 Tax=Bacillus TaxID=1386 RepID=UPI00100A6108|nr:hypothetical protein [Bacillus velezensis]MEC3795357.1 hypothetical protein [Bacillus velezensis]MED3333601.1 hypothetical protein [Bacillus velezensis]MED3674984.1 hypothetical protein [Bacillus velezensis]RXK28554.1 hypothetical protein A6g_13865 [Bacillus velezensis]WRT01570.1 hypothetical protein VO179_16345 [Bacillus velezensis]